jgi:HK97 family phage major capsid protein
LITLGDGTGAVQGYTTYWGNYSNVTANSNSSISYSDLSTTVNELPVQFLENASFTFNLSTYTNQILSIKDTSNRPLFLENQTGNGTHIGSIFGFPAYINPYMNNVGPGNVAVTFGDHNAAYSFLESPPFNIDMMSKAVVDQSILNSTYPFVIKLSSQRYGELNRLGVMAYTRIGGLQTQAANSASPLIWLFKN